MRWIERSVRRAFNDWETEVARPIVVATLTALLFFLFSLMFAPVRRFLFSDVVSYPIYCTAETYSTSPDLTQARTEIVLVNTTQRDLSREDLEKELSGGGEAGLSPNLHLTYQRAIGHVTAAAADVAYNTGKGDLIVKLNGNEVVIQPQHFNPRAILRVNIDVMGLDAVEITRAAHEIVPFRVDLYERGCYSR